MNFKELNTKYEETMGLGWIGVDVDFFAPFDGHHTAADILPEPEFAEALSVQFGIESRSEHVQPLGKHEHLLGLEQVGNGHHDQRAERHHQIGPDAIQDEIGRAHV